jgi:two-component system, NarL family, nitrate/nitrite response regulator NarL
MTAQTLTLVNHRSSEPGPGLTPAIPTALICDNPVLHSGLQHILWESAFALSEAAFAAGSGRLKPVASPPALVIIEAKQSASHLVEVARQAREQFPEARIVVLADQFDLSFVRLGHEAGVDGFCLAASAPEVLIKSFELVMLGETVMPSAVLRSIMDEAAQHRNQPLQGNSAEPKLSELTTCKLSAREAQILNCLREGAPNKVIARKLDITEATIKVHVKAILRKIGATNRTQAAMWASQRLPSRGVSTLNV